MAHTLPIYNPTEHSDRLFFETRVDFGGNRCVVRPIHIVQYDKTMPVVAVSLYKNGSTYTLPEAITAIKVRWGKKDHTFVIKDILGISSDGKIAYFEVDEQMSFFYGPCNPILELRVGNNVIGGSSPMPFEIDRNPVQTTDIESHSEYPDLERALERAEEAVEKAEAALEKSTDAEAWAVGEKDGEPVPSTAPQYENNAKYYAEETSEMAEAASISATNAANSADDAFTYEQKIENMQVEAQVLPVNSNPTVTKEEVLTYFKLKFGMPVPKQITGIEKIDTQDEVDTYRISFNDNTHFDFTVTNAEITGAVLSVNGRQGNVTGLMEDDGFYEGAGVGFALVASDIEPTIGIEENDLFSFRTSGGNKSIGNIVNEKYIEGGSIAIQQLVNKASYPNNQTKEGITWTFDKETGEITSTGTSTGDSVLSICSLPLLEEHKYLLIGAPKNNINNQAYLLFRRNANNFYTYNTDVIFSSNDTYNSALSVRVVSGDAPSNVWRPQIFDLTAIFGSTIADYLATLPIDQALAKIKPWIDTNKYYPYSATPTFKHVNLLKKKVVGFNQWDEETELYGQSNIVSKNFIPTIPSTSYYFKFPTTNSNELRVSFYDINKQPIIDETTGYNYMYVSSNQTRIIPKGCYYIKFRTENYGSSTYKNDICINISHSGAHNGEYQPYEEHEYDMPSGELHGILKLDANNNIVYDGDRYYADGHIDDRYGIVDLGTLYYVKRVYNDAVIFIHQNLENAIPTPGGTGKANAVCTKYDLQTNFGVSVNDKSFAIDTYWSTGANLYIRDSALENMSVSEFKTAMSGVYLVYEKATPTTSQATPYQELQIVDDWGTEEFINVDNVDMPVQHYAIYKVGLRDKLQNLPNNAENGTYNVVHQNGTQQELVDLDNTLTNKGYLNRKDEADLNVNLAKNLDVETGTIIDANISVSSGDNYADRANNAKGTGTYFPYGENDWVTVENANENIEKAYGHSYVKNQLVGTGATAGSPSGGLTPTINATTRAISVTGTVTSNANVVVYSAKSILNVGHKYIYLVPSVSNAIGVWRDSYNSINFNSNCIFTATSEFCNLRFISEAIGQEINITGFFSVVDINILDQDLANTPNLTVDMVLKAYPDILNWEYDAGTMIDAEDFTYSSSGIQLFDGILEIGGISTSNGANIAQTDRCRFQNYAKLIGGRSYHFVRGGNFSTTVYKYDKNKVFIGYADLGTVATQFNLEPNVEYVRFMLRTTDTTVKFQLTLHYTDTEVENTYHQYVAPSTKEIKYYGGKGRSAGSVRDEVDYVAKKRRKLAKQIVLNGTENWIAYSVSSSINQYYINVQNVISSADNIQTTCDRYPSIKIGDRRDKVGCCYTGSDSICFNFNVADKTLEQWKQELSANPITVNYATTDIVEEDIPLEEQNNVLSCNDYGIEIKSDNVIAGMRVRYQPNAKRTIFNNKADIEKLKELIGTNNAELTNKLIALGFKINEPVHDVRVNTSTALGTYNYQFELPTTDLIAYTQLGQIGHYLFVNKPNVRIPASGVYVENTTLYVITSIRSSTNDNMVIVEMYKASDGTLKEIETGIVSVNDTIL